MGSTALQDELLAGLSTQAGFVCNKEDINADKGMFSYSGVFQEVDARIATKNGKVIFACFPQCSSVFASLMYRHICLA